MKKTVLALLSVLVLAGCYETKPVPEGLTEDNFYVGTFKFIDLKDKDTYYEVVVEKAVPAQLERPDGYEPYTGIGKSKVVITKYDLSGIEKIVDKEIFWDVQNPEEIDPATIVNPYLVKNYFKNSKDFQWFIDITTNSDIIEDLVHFEFTANEKGFTVFLYRGYDNEAECVAKNLAYFSNWKTEPSFKDSDTMWRDDFEKLDINNAAAFEWNDKRYKSAIKN